jgi:primary-amine oxidase
MGACLDASRNFCLNNFYRCAYNAILSFKDGSWSVDSLDLLSESEHPQISVEELVDAELVVRNNERVQQLAKEVGEYLRML